MIVNCTNKNLLLIRLKDIDILRFLVLLFKIYTYTQTETLNSK